MSTVKSYLVLVFIDLEVTEEERSDSNWVWSLPFEQTQGVLALEDISRYLKPARTERHICFELLQSLTEGQRWGLEQLKQKGFFTNFYVKDEISRE